MSKAPSTAPRTAAVIGGGIAGLVAARELTRAGMRVTIIEASSQLGGALRAHQVGGLTLDAGAESYAISSQAVPELATALGLGESLVQPNPAGAWLYGPASGRGHSGEQQGGRAAARLSARRAPVALPLPEGTLWGIPGDFDDPVLGKILGRAGLARAKLDRTLPKSRGRGTVTLGDLVQARMGKAVLERLVLPVMGGVYSVDPSQLVADAVLPGIHAALAEHGSLSAAVTAMRPAGARPGAAVGGLRGGMFQLTPALAAELEEAGVEVLLSTRVESVQQAGDGQWLINASVAQRQVDELVVATDVVSARALLGGVVPQLAAFEGVAQRELTVVTVVVDRPELDAAPRGTGVLVSPRVSEVHAKALTHATAKWSWLSEEEGPGTHVLRLSYTGVEVGLERALTDASVLLGEPVTVADVLDWDQLRWTSAVPAVMVEHRQARAQLREALQGQSLRFVGAWIAGHSLSAVIADTQAHLGGLR